MMMLAPGMDPEFAKNRPFLSTGIMTAACVLLIAGSQLYLGMSFEWEGRPVGEVLAMYRGLLPSIRLVWFAFAVGALLMIPVALLYHSCFGRRDDVLSRIGAAFGALAGLSYSIGVMRWVQLADLLSATYASAPGDGYARMVAEDLFRAFNAYSGNGFGETIAPLGHAVWSACLGITILRNADGRDRASRVFAVLFLALTPGIAIRPLEYVGVGRAAAIGDASTLAWSALFLAFGARLCWVGARLRRKRDR